MKRFLLFSLFIFPAFFVCRGSVPGKSDVAVRELRVDVKGDSLCVSFLADIGRDATGGQDYKLTLVPLLADSAGLHSARLRPVEVYGRRVEIFDSRERGKASGGLAPDDLRLPLPGAVHGIKGSTLRYRCCLAWEPWMNGALLSMERTRSGCCRSETLPAVVLAPEAVRIYPPVVPPLAATLLALEAKRGGTADSLARIYPFVEPVSRLDRACGKGTDGTLFNPDMPLNMGRGTEPGGQRRVEDFIAAGEQGSLMVHFPQGRSTVDRYFRDNNTSLVRLISAIRAINASQDARISKVIIAGFASPEGSLEKNDRLAWERAVALKTFILNNSRTPSREIRLFNGSEDWRGLRRLVAESDLYEKDRILDIIDNVPVRKGRELQLMKLSGGVPYRYMLENMFPELRNAAYIKVYYENLPDSGATTLHRAAALVEKGSYGEASQLLSTLAPGAPRDHLLGICLLAGGDTAAARVLLEDAAAAGNEDSRLLLDELDIRHEAAKGRSAGFAPVRMRLK